MMGYPHASVLVLLHVFASLLLLVAANAFAGTENVSNALQTGQPASSPYPNKPTSLYAWKRELPR